MSSIFYSSNDALSNSRVTDLMRLTPIIPIPRPIDDGWFGGASGYESAWHWEFGSVYKRPSRIDIIFYKKKCENLGVSREYCRDQFSDRYPGGIMTDDEHHDTISLRYYMTSVEPDPFTCAGLL